MTIIFIFVFTVAAFVTAAAATYLVAQAAQEAWAAWVEAEREAREAHLAALSARLFMSRAESGLFEQAWAEARVCSNEALAWVQKAQARAEQARAWEMRTQRRKG